MFWGISLGLVEIVEICIGISPLFALLHTTRLLSSSVCDGALCYKDMKFVYFNEDSDCSFTAVATAAGFTKPCFYFEF